MSRRELILRTGFALILLAGAMSQVVKAKPADEFDCGPASGRSEIKGYEPSTIGWTKDSDDVGFLDFKLSVAYRLPVACNWYFMATVRFGQYVVERDSSPVIGKRFNPKLTYRFQREFGYLDVSYAHESNGQSVTTVEQYNAVATQQKNPSWANDYISRGWDYVGLSGRFAIREFYVDAVYVDLKHFLRNGLLQGPREEFHDWETSPELKGRNRVNGVAAMTKKEWKPCAGATLCHHKLVVAYETGYLHPFRYNTVRAELGTKLWGVPFILMLANGYSADLAQYFKKTSSIGLAVEVGGF